MYLYPNNLRAKPMLWLWHLKDVVIIGIITLFAVFIYAQFNKIYLLVAAAAYAILSLRFDDLSILDILIHLCHFFILEQQTFTWKNERMMTDE
ncbi:hypothetical protein K210_04700 [Erysipelothrix rhusiopathiae SY1027]|uniref:hypothetical protein n=1 Tax=Erysipelothrix rhusiopathiae TaxID=1648 RepID=UPI000334830C|nr:hypothetical protein [Erysipelothrix rhusiopathiae]AGN24543.1 hypothetical protein K210_04700 [Erysipelothrix rhusiopathiae SY1027]